MSARSRAVSALGGVFPRQALLLGVVALSACGASASAARSSAAVAGTSIVAQARGSQVSVFRVRTAARPSWVVRNPRGDGSPVVFLVVRRVPGWDEVRLAIRPDGSVGWVRARSVTLALDPYRIAVSLNSHRLQVWLRGRMILEARVANGTAALPTPTGIYYIVELLKQVDGSGAYGPYAFGLSAYSRVLFSFGGGPGQIGLHGTDEPDLLGTSASHGCVRVANAVIVRLAHILPLGTPVVISK